MAVVVFDDGYVIVYDCNITDNNERAVFAFMRSFMPKNTIDLFVNSHRDADHMRGLRRLHRTYPIGAIWDSEVSANTETAEYQDYMRLRREIGFHVVGSGNYLQHKPNVRILNGRRHGLDDPNSQSIVMHIDEGGSSLMLAGDTNCASWRDYILREYPTTLESMVLYASHHGSYTFINDSPDNNPDFSLHLAHMRPAVALFSVGENNPHGHPDPRALRHYERHCRGTNGAGEKVFRTDQHGNMRVALHGDGTGTLYWGL